MFPPAFLRLETVVTPAPPPTSAEPPDPWGPDRPPAPLPGPLPWPHEPDWKRPVDIRLSDSSGQVTPRGRAGRNRDAIERGIAADG